MVGKEEKKGGRNSNWGKRGIKAMRKEISMTGGNGY
jgi:hypothetical protein